MEDIFVGQLMSSPVWAVGHDTAVRDAANTMIEQEIGSVVVVDDDNELEGILTATDFISIVAEDEADPDAEVSAYMTADVVTTTADKPIDVVAETMVEHGFHHVPVVESDEGVVGMITTTDLTAYLSTVRTPNPQ